MATHWGHRLRCVEDVDRVLGVVTADGNELAPNLYRPAKQSSGEACRD
jgi:hypothetical protein